MNKDMEMLHHLAHESKQPLFHFRKYILSDRVREIFKRTKADFVSINCSENFETSPTYKPKTCDEKRLDGK